MVILLVRRMSSVRPASASCVSTARPSSRGHWHAELEASGRVGLVTSLAQLGNLESKSLRLLSPVGKAQRCHHVDMCGQFQQCSPRARSQSWRVSQVWRVYLVGQDLVGSGFTGFRLVYASPISQALRWDGEMRMSRSRSTLAACPSLNPSCEHSGTPLLPRGLSPSSGALA